MDLKFEIVCLSVRGIDFLERLYSVMIKYTFDDMNTCGFFNRQRSKSKTPSITRNVLSADDDSLVATSLEEAQELANRCFQSFEPYH